MAVLAGLAIHACNSDGVSKRTRPKGTSGIKSLKTGLQRLFKQF